MPRIVTATHVAICQVSLDKNAFKRKYQTTVFVAGMAHDFHVFSQLIAILQKTLVVSILSWLKHS